MVNFLLENRQDFPFYFTHKKIEIFDAALNADNLDLASLVRLRSEWKASMLI